MQDKNGDGRSQRFASRIGREREILSIINSSRIAQHSPLAGMTYEAIIDWEQRIRRAAAPSHLRDIMKLLFEIGRRMNFLADDSRMPFDTIGLNDEDAIAGLKVRLKSAVQL